MADLSLYQTLEEKRKYFQNGNQANFIINTTSELDKWFTAVETDKKEFTSRDATAFIYRGLSDAKYKLMTSSQRIWISNEMQQWSAKSYTDFIIDLVKNANKNPIIKKAFDLYNYSSSERDFPILSLLQHYGAPTPLMDWTYNSNVAFFFATDGLVKKELPKQEIDNYLSIYRINKRKYKRELLNIIDFIPDKSPYPAIADFKNLHDERQKNANVIFYISDFERRRESTGEIIPSKNLIIRTRKPITSVYNQNIIPQEGLFIFNPFSNKTLEDIFNMDLGQDGWNLRLTPFDCFNIHKDLAEYLRRKIEKRFGMKKSFIYPNLKDEAQKIKEETLNGLI